MSDKLISVLLGAGTTILVLVAARLLGASGVLGMAGGGAFCCLAVVGGAIVAVLHASRRSGARVLAGPGAGLGTLATGLGAAVLMGVTTLLAGPIDPAARDAQMEMTRQQLIEQGITGPQLDQAIQAAAVAQGPLGNVFLVIGVAIMGAIAGAIAATMTRDRSGDAAAI